MKIELVLKAITIGDDSTISVGVSDTAKLHFSKADSDFKFSAWATAFVTEEEARKHTLGQKYVLTEAPPTE